MKISLPIFIITCILTFSMVSCNTDSIYQEEQYKTLVYLLSGTDNVFAASYTLNEEEAVRYISVGCGGSNSNEKDITVTLEPNPGMLDKYNSLNYNYDSEYAKMLPSDRYKIESYSVTLPANSDYHYARIPVKVRTLGLSPDSIYFIPLKIKTVSNYDVNESKSDVLFRVAIENDYAQQLVPTYYTKSGTMTNPITVLSGTKLVQPLEKDKVRMFVGNEKYGSSTTIDNIKNLSVVVQILEDNSLIVTPYGSMEVEMLNNAKGYNKYIPELLQGTTKQSVFYLNYRFRLKQSNGTFSPWREVEERLIRIEEN
ncbi:MAG: DUF1735 domain-containing protein [Dysgonamonadaceae bacterium]|nr:DUF1735 domain-containing protein [Dysgonamonadaceae bacterium]MDD3308853.1 DUF1735 domain-containing protein [Dysgonamonadaceae bacterium]MDD3900563.1 DUF1735 domain-containing protein [Dysgonamonadaceae bacterium]MDD4398996.1 DUF1735 domain-containing protein [Dysgonamonadaceae bacterium]